MNEIDSDNKDNEMKIKENEQEAFKNIIKEFKGKEKIKKLNETAIININNLDFHLPENKYKKVNKDGTITETKTLVDKNGNKKIINIRYDKYHNVLSKKVFTINNNNNNNNVRNNNIIKRNIYKTPNGLSVETIIEQTPNNRKKIVRIIKDENDMIIDTQEEFIEENNIQFPQHGMIPQNMPMGGRAPLPPPPYNLYNMQGYFNFRPMPLPFFPPYFPVYPNYDPNRLNPFILNSLEVKKINDVEKLGEENKSCIICLEEFKNNESIIWLPCFHLFHNDCIRSWFERNNLCPKCKSKISLQ